MPESNGEFTRCRACKAPIRFVLTHPKRKSMPIDPRPVSDGTIRLEPSFEGTLGIVLTGDLLDAAREAREQLYVSHFATCPSANRFRRKNVPETDRRAA